MYESFWLEKDGKLINLMNMKVQCVELSWLMVCGYQMANMGGV